MAADNRAASDFRSASDPMQVFRRSRFASWFALLAIFVQLLLPARHAAMLAHPAADPLQAAFCGKASTAALQQLQASAPAELKAALHLRSSQEQAQASGGHCAFCGASSAMQIDVLVGGAPTLNPLSLRHEAVMVRAQPISPPAQIPLLLGRGPPLTA